MTSEQSPAIGCVIATFAGSCASAVRDKAKVKNTPTSVFIGHTLSDSSNVSFTLDRHSAVSGYG
jgi:hypothetical protein